MHTRIRRALLFASVLLSVLLAVAACGGGSSKGESTNARIAGSWQYQSGPLISGINIGGLTYLDLARSGSGTLFTKSQNSGILGCASLIFAIVNDTVVTVQLPAVENPQSNETVYYFTYVVSGGTLTLTDPEGIVTTFKKVDAIPADSECGVLGSGATMVLSTSATSRSSLSSDGVKLSYTNADENRIVTFDPETQASTSFDLQFFSQYRYVIAQQGTALWLDCFCGNNSDIQLEDASANVGDTVSTTPAPISQPIDIRSGTFDNGTLWLAGYPETNFAFGGGGGGVSLGKVLKIDSVSEPDVLTGSFAIDTSPAGMAFRGSRLFVLGNFLGPVLIELDPATGDALGTYKLPEHNWVGIATAGGVLYGITADYLVPSQLTVLDPP